MNKLRNKVAFLGLGQCGSNLSTMFENLDYNNLVINSSQQDLDATNAKHKIKLKSDGCSKNRDKAKMVMLESVDTIVEEICTILTEPIIFVCFSAGGGTGSGISSFIIEALTECNKLVIPVCVLPNEKLESIKACDNTFKCLAELEQIDGVGTTMLIDNSTRKTKQLVNSDFVDMLNAFLTVEGTSKKGNFDTDEKTTILSTKGITVMSKVSKEKSSIANLISGIDSSVFCPIERDKVITYMGIMVAKADVVLDDFVKEFGEPYDDFRGYGSNFSMLVLSGLTMPSTRIDSIKSKVISNKDRLTQNIQKLQTTVLDSNEDLLGDIFSTVKKPKEAKKLSSRDLLMKQLRGNK